MFMPNQFNHRANDWVHKDSTGFIHENHSGGMAALLSPLNSLVGRKFILLLCSGILVLKMIYNQQESKTLTTQAVLANRTLPEVPFNKYKPTKCNANLSYLPMVAKEDILARFGSGMSPREICGCNREIITEKLPHVLLESCCSDEATLLGTNQHAISFSLFSKPTSTWNYTKHRYFDGILDNLRLMKEIYPDWVMRVYSNLSYSPEVCNVVCSDDSLYFCDVHHLSNIGDVSKIHPMTWRFLVMGDPTVNEFAIRDLDSRLSQREKDAVVQWEESGYPVHGMRDHYEHGTPIMGGMWGADNYKLCLDIARDIQLNILNWSISGFDDQETISIVLYEPYKTKILTHDSFTCEEFPDSVPFPSRRPNDWEHVGGYLWDVDTYTTRLEECPPACRPEYGKDWKYC